MSGERLTDDRLADFLKAELEAKGYSLAQVSTLYPTIRRMASSLHRTFQIDSLYLQRELTAKMKEGKA